MWGVVSTQIDLVEWRESIIILFVNVHGEESARGDQTYSNLSPPKFLVVRREVEEFDF